MIRGPIVHFYPYPFVDVDAHGYPVVLFNSALIGLLVLGRSSGEEKWARVDDPVGISGGRGCLFKPAPAI